MEGRKSANTNTFREEVVNTIALEGLMWLLASKLSVDEPVLQLDKLSSWLVVIALCFFS